MGVQKISKTQRVIHWIITLSVLGMIGYVVVRAIMYEMRPRTLISINKTVYRADLVEDPNKVNEGFGRQKSLGVDEALLYRYDTDSDWGIQMKNMNFPVDIVWVGSDKRVVDLKQGVKPDAVPYETHKPVVPARYIIGLASGQAKKSGIKVDTQIKFDISEEGL